jgi:hypothetical protein
MPIEKAVIGENIADIDPGGAICASRIGQTSKEKKKKKKVQRMKLKLTRPCRSSLSIALSGSAGGIGCERPRGGDRRRAARNLPRDQGQGDD